MKTGTRAWIASAPLLQTSLDSDSVWVGSKSIDYSATKNRRLPGCVSCHSSSMMTRRGCQWRLTMVPPCQRVAGLLLLLLSSSLGMVTTTRAAIARTTPSSVYVNLPFCRRRCFYCDFPIKVVGDRPGAAADAAKPYIDNLVREIRTTAAASTVTLDPPIFPGNVRAATAGVPANGNNDGQSSSSGVVVGSNNNEQQERRGRRGARRDGGGGSGVSTLFFGGGTPSLCPPELVASVVDVVRECYGIADGAEISMEMDPGTFDEKRLHQFLSLGITRVSMGVQSFDASLLEACGRAHSLDDVYQAVDLIRDAGVENWSVDVMSGLPKQTEHQWEHTLSEAVSTGATHFSVYDLQVETGTSFGRWYTGGESPLPQDETCADMYRTASRVLRGAGYDHYEISNYARPGFQSRHNRAYWENVPFLAFGNGAASYVDGRRFSRPRGLPEYGRWVDKLEAEGWTSATATAAEGGGGEGGGGGPSDEAVEKDSLLDDVMLGFRLMEGLDLDAICTKYGDDAAMGVEAGVAEGLQRGWVLHDGKVEAKGIVADTEGDGRDLGLLGNDRSGNRAGNGGNDDDDAGRTGLPSRARSGSFPGGDDGDDAVIVDDNDSDEKMVDRSSWSSNSSSDEIMVDGSSSSSSGSSARHRVYGDMAGLQNGAVVGDVSSGGGGGGGGGSASAGLESSEDESGGRERIGRSPSKRGRLRLSDPDGFLFSNSVISSVFCELDGWKRY